MGATSVTGKGTGDSDKATTKQLSALANGPSILISGISHSEEQPVSPVAFGATITFPNVLPGGAENYVVLLTAFGGLDLYLADKDEVDGNFSGFTYYVDSECDVMYIVCKVGIRPS